MATRWLFGTHEDELPPSPDLEDAAGDDVIPEQLPSILGQRACITYYVDGAREPTTVATSDAAVCCYDAGLGLGRRREPRPKNWDKKRKLRGQSLYWRTRLVGTAAGA